MYVLYTLILACSAPLVSLCAPHILDPSGALVTGGRPNDHAPELPLQDANNSGMDSLPAPSARVKYVLLGLGYQNYSCDTTSGIWTQNVPQGGAVASLYDVTGHISNHTHDSITRTAVKTFEACLKFTACMPYVNNGYCRKCHLVATASRRHQFVGEHFFERVNGTQTPSFDIWAYKDFLSATKVGSIAAPAGAYAGENKLGALAWLFLEANGSPKTKHLNSVYRVETAGGLAPRTCTQSDKQIQVAYAALYWFYPSAHSTIHNVRIMH